MIVLTDGKQTQRGDVTPLDVAAAPFKSMNVKVYTVGVGKNVDRKELEDIASAPENVIVSSSFKTLNEKIIDLRAAGCKGRT